MAMLDAARHALSHYCSLFGELADDLNIRYYTHHHSGSVESVIVSPIGEGKPRLSAEANPIAVLTTELDHSLDKLSRARKELMKLCVELVECQY